VTALINPAGWLVAQYAYDPYGQLLLARGPVSKMNSQLERIPGFTPRPSPAFRR